MTVEKFINAGVPSLLPGATAAQALDTMEDVLQAELAVVSVDGEFLGLARQSLLEALPSDDIMLDQLPALGENCAVVSGQHFFELLQKAAECKTAIVAVLSNEGQYLGTVLMADLAQAMGQNLSLNIPGGLLVLLVNERDYSLTEISRLVESNDAKILNSFIEAEEDDPLKIRVSLRINQTDLSRIVNTFERFGYIIAARYFKSDTPNLDKERYDSLMRFLDV